MKTPLLRYRSQSNDSSASENLYNDLHNLLDQDLKLIYLKYKTAQNNTKINDTQPVSLPKLKKQTFLKAKKLNFPNRKITRKQLYNTFRRATRTTQMPFSIKILKKLAFKCEKEIFLYSKKNAHKYKSKLLNILKLLTTKKRNYIILDKLFKQELTSFQLVNVKSDQLIQTKEKTKKKKLRCKYTQKITDLNLENLILIKTPPIPPLSPSINSSYECLFNFFNTILQDFHLYNENVERQILKYKLRKMEAVYALSDEERLKIKDLFLEKFPDLVLFVLLESQNYLLTDLEDKIIKNFNKKDINQELTKIRTPLPPLTHRQERIFKEMIWEKENRKNVQNKENIIKLMSIDVKPTAYFRQEKNS